MSYDTTIAVPTNDLKDFLRQSSDIMNSHGFIINDRELFDKLDGKIHRCSVEKSDTGKTNNKDGSFVIFNNLNIFIIWFMRWDEEEKILITSKNKNSFTPKEKKIFKEIFENLKNNVNKEIEERQKIAKEKSIVLWNESNYCTDDHPYLKNKKVKSHNLKISKYTGDIIIDIYENLDTKEIVNLQFIKKDGKKIFYPGCKIKDCFHIIKFDEDENVPIMICEGYSTGASIYESTGYSVVITFTVHNLLAVTKKIKEKYPNRKICICCDNDCTNEKNIGVIEGTKVSNLTNSYISIPEYENNKVDFNDLMILCGHEKVKETIDKSLNDEPVFYPENYYINDSGLHFISDKGEYYISPKLEILGISRDTNSENWGVTISFLDKDGKEHICTISKRSLRNTNKSEIMGNLDNIDYSVDKTKENLFVHFLYNIKTNKRITTVYKTGWYKNIYILPNKKYGCGSETVILDSLNRTINFNSNGILEKWKDLYKLSINNIILSFSLCVSLSGTLLEKTGIDGCGFNIEGDSSIGKTTSLYISSSIWSDPNNHIRSWRSTSNSLEVISCQHNDNTLFLDEISQIESSELSECIYMLSNGQGKNRLNKNSELKDTYKWKLLFLSTGEQGLSDKLLEKNIKVKGGQDVRFIGIPTTKEDIKDLHGYGTSDELVREIKELSKDTYGVAGQEWLKCITNPLNKDIIENYVKKINYYSEKLLKYYNNPSGQVKRVARRFSLLIISGLLAEEFGIFETPNKDEYWFNTIKTCFDRWLEKRGGVESSEEYKILRDIKVCIDTHGSSRFQNINDQFESRCDNRIGWKRQSPKEIDKTEYLFTQESLSKETGFDYKKVVKVLKNNGWLIKYDEKRNTVQMRINGDKKYLYPIIVN